MPVFYFITSLCCGPCLLMLGAPRGQCLGHLHYCLGKAGDSPLSSFSFLLFSEETYFTCFHLEGN
ncbi:hypothetical protein RchiOBHm_Chr6g0254521 [Rosa chinensis]|uniref:Secreted protein n=1 Tax=Rosa chinensis TaxID=74649 RepID=A0A2P6PLM1_ROSCH|nr:hypothetical protein RchiOBHm_Chr6g0254521 [Rosa chinensis]